MSIGQSDTITEKKIDVKKPDMYKVIMLNDDYTTMEFVVGVLINIFHKNSSDAQRIMMEVHEKGVSEVGVYTYDIAQSKIQQVHSVAKKYEYPLKCRVEKA